MRIIALTLALFAFAPAKADQALVDAVYAAAYQYLGQARLCEAIFNDAGLNYSRTRTEVETSLKARIEATEAIEIANLLHKNIVDDPSWAPIISNDPDYPTVCRAQIAEVRRAFDHALIKAGFR